MSAEASGRGGSYAEERRRWPTKEEKERADWGERQAQSLWDNLYSRLGAAVDDRVVLDLGCSWGYVLRFLAERFEPRQLVGTDLSPAWRTVDHGWDYAQFGDRVRFLEGDLATLDGLEPESVDLILCASVLQYMTPEGVAANISRCRELLRPGGAMLLRTRVYTSYLGADLHRQFPLPYSHLLYPEETLAELYEASRKRKPPYLNWLTASSYMMIFHDAGFEIADARRRFNKTEPDVMSRVAARYPWIDENELNCAEVEARLVKSAPR